MAVRSKEELMEIINTRFPDDTTDETLAFIEDISDTYDNLYANKSEDWKTKYEQLQADSERKYNELDEGWKKKYRDRFFDSSDPLPEPESDPEPKEVKTYEDLFD